MQNSNEKKKTVKYRAHELTLLALGVTPFTLLFVWLWNESPRYLGDVTDYFVLSALGFHALIINAALYAWFHEPSRAINWPCDNELMAPEAISVEQEKARLEQRVLWWGNQAFKWIGSGTVLLLIFCTLHCIVEFLRLANGPNHAILIDAIDPLAALRFFKVMTGVHFGGLLLKHLYLEPQARSDARTQRRFEGHQWKIEAKAPEL